MLLYFEPAFFCNVNDAWTFPELKARLGHGGWSWIQVVVASLAAIVWWAATPGTLISHIALSAVLVGGITTVVMNANPLIPLDGYFALSDCLEVPEPAAARVRLSRLGWSRRASAARRAGARRPTSGKSASSSSTVSSPLVHHFDHAARRGERLRLARSRARAGGRRPVRLGVWLMSRSAIRSAVADGSRWREFRARVATGACATASARGRARARAGRDHTAAHHRDRCFAVAPALSVPLTAPDSGIVARCTSARGPASRPACRWSRSGPRARAGDARTGRRVDSLAAREAQARAAGQADETARLEAERATEAARLGGMTAQQLASDRARLCRESWSPLDPSGSPAAGSAR